MMQRLGNRRPTGGSSAFLGGPVHPARGGVGGDDQRDSVRYVPCARADPQHADTDEEGGQISVISGRGTLHVEHHPPTTGGSQQGNGGRGNGGGGGGGVSGSFTGKPVGSTHQRGDITVGHDRTGAASMMVNGPTVISTAQLPAEKIQQPAATSGGNVAATTSSGSCVAKTHRLVPFNVGGASDVTKINKPLTSRDNVSEETHLETRYRARQVTTPKAATTPAWMQGKTPCLAVDVSFVNKGHTIEPPSLTPRHVRRQRRKEIAKIFGRKRGDDSSTRAAGSDKDGCRWTLVFDPSGRYLSYFLFCL